MLTQEEYMDVVAMRRQGWTIGQIADAVGAHPATISSWLKKGGPPPKRQPPSGHVPVIDERWASRVGQLLEANPELLGTSVERILRAEGFTGSYESLVRHLRDVRGARRRRSPGVSVPVETAPGAEFQFDWSDCCDWGETWGLGDLHCFGAVLCFSRRRHWYFAPSIDRPHTFEGLLRFFEDVGGIAAIGRTDRMGALGVSRGGIFRFCPEAIDFASYHGFAFKACRAKDAKRKAWATDCTSCWVGEEDVVRELGVIADAEVERSLLHAVVPRMHRSDSSLRSTCGAALARPAR